MRLKIRKLLNRSILKKSRDEGVLAYSSAKITIFIDGLIVHIPKEMRDKESVDEALCWEFNLMREV